jgi:hypothetical protein
MTKSTPIRAGVPHILEQLVPDSILRGDISHVPYYNETNETIVPGEPVVKFGKIGLSAKAILPDQMGTLRMLQIADFVLDPDFADEIEQGDLVYWDYDLEDDTHSGYATNEAPTNGILLGHAVIVPDSVASIPMSYGGAPMAAEAGNKLVRVLVTQLTPTTYGTIPTF